MRVASSPLLVESDEPVRTTDLLTARELTAPDHVAAQVRSGQDWLPVRTAELAEDVRAVARGLLGAGLRTGDRIAIFAATSYSWCIADQAAWWAGLVVVPVYDTASPVQLQHILADSGACAVIAGTARQAELAREAGVARVWNIDRESRHGLGEVVALGAGVTSEELEQRRRGVTGNDIATISYTSGTTGPLQGARITHANLVGLARNVQALYSATVHERARTVIVLPLAHILARALQLLAIGAGMRISHVSDPLELIPSLPQLRPTFLVVVPRVLEKVRNAARKRADGKRLGGVWYSAERTAIAWGRHLEGQQEEPTARAAVVLRMRHALYERVFYHRLRAVLGGQIEYLLCGAAALDASLSHFFRGVGLPVIEGYGLTETTAPATGNRLGDLRAGSVGTPMPGTEIAIAQDGEVLIRGIGVCDGYTDAAATRRAFPDGWLHTGDLGRLDSAGRLWLTGRAKDLIVTSGGKNVSPAGWETAVGQDPLIAHAILVGDGRPYCAAILLLDREELRAWAERTGNDEVVQMARCPAPGLGLVIEDPALLAHLSLAVDAANAALARAEQARRYLAVLCDLDGLITPTMKLRRSTFLGSAEPLINQLYAPRA